MEISAQGYDQSPTIGKLAEALAKAQEEMGHALADSDNPHFKSKFADLASMKDASRPIHKQGLSVMQAVLSKEDGTPGLRTTLAHSSGEWVASWAYCKPERPGPQAIGAVLTYLRRYMLAGILSIAQEDDDGNSAERPRGQSNGNGHQQSAPPAPQPPPRPAAAPERQRPWMGKLQAAVAALGLGDGQAVAEGMKGKKKDDFVRDCRIKYLRWCAGRDTINSTLDLTDQEADVVIRRAELGEMPS